MRWTFPFLAACVVFATAGPSAAETVQAHHARIELLSQEKSAEPGRQLLLGLHFMLEKDWHIYWINSGDSGQPPVLSWQLPSGFHAGEIEWPTPEKLTRASLADYGYKDDVTLLIPIQIPVGLKTDSRIDIGLKVKWLICSDVCIPDHAELHLSLPGTADSTGAFATALSHLPKPWPRSWIAQAVSDKDNFVVTINAGKPIASAEIFPLTPEQIENAAPQPLQKTPRGARITLKKSDQLLHPISALKGLLVVGAQAYQMQARVISKRP